MRRPAVTVGLPSLCTYERLRKTALETIIVNFLYKNTMVTGNFILI